MLRNNARLIGCRSKWTTARRAAACGRNFSIVWCNLSIPSASRIQLLYYPPYHSKYNPIERCWGIMELHWNGTQLLDVETMLEWAKRMTWKGLKPVVELSRKVYAKGVSLSKTAMQAVEARLERNPLLPKWDILIHPTRAT